MQLTIGHIELFVSDPGASMIFYRDVLGFEVVAVQGDDFVWMGGGSIELLLRRGTPKPGEGPYDRSSCGIVLYTGDLDATVAELTQRGLAFDGTDGSGPCLTFRDPDGHWFQLVDPTHH